MSVGDASFDRMFDTETRAVPVVAPTIGSSPPASVTEHCAPSLEEMSTQRLEADICALAGHLAAATCQ